MYSVQYQCKMFPEHLVYIHLQNYFYAVMLLNPKGNECCSIDKILLKPIYGLINHDHPLLFR